MWEKEEKEFIILLIAIPFLLPGGEDFMLKEKNRTYVFFGKYVELWIEIVLDSSPWLYTYYLSDLIEVL